MSVHDAANMDMVDMTGVPVCHSVETLVLLFCIVATMIINSISN